MAMQAKSPPNYGNSPPSPEEWNRSRYGKEFKHPALQQFTQELGEMGDKIRASRGLPSRAEAIAARPTQPNWDNPPPPRDEYRGKFPGFNNGSAERIPGSATVPRPWDQVPQAQWGPPQGAPPAGPMSAQGGAPPGMENIEVTAPREPDPMAQMAGRQKQMQLAQMAQSMQQPTASQRLMQQSQALRGQR